MKTLAFLLSITLSGMLDDAPARDDTDAFVLENWGLRLELQTTPMPRIGRLVHPIFDEPAARPVIQRMGQEGFRPFFFLSGLYYTFENEGVGGSQIPSAAELRRRSRERKTQSVCIERDKPDPTLEAELARVLCGRSGCRRVLLPGR